MYLCLIISNGACRAGPELCPALSEGLRKLASSAAAAASNSMASVESADTLSYMMSSMIAVHHESCLYTRDKLVVGKFKYDTLMSNKPPVYSPLCLLAPSDPPPFCTRLCLLSPVYTIQPVVKPLFTTGLTTGCIAYALYNPV